MVSRVQFTNLLKCFCDCRFCDSAFFLFFFLISWSTIQLYRKIHCAVAAVEMTHLSNVLVVNQLNNKAFEQQSEVSYVGVLMPVSCCCGSKRPFSSFIECPPWFRPMDVVFHERSETGATCTRKERARDRQWERERVHSSLLASWYVNKGQDQNIYCSAMQINFSSVMSTLCFGTFHHHHLNFYSNMLVL